MKHCNLSAWSCEEWTTRDTDMCTIGKAPGTDTDTDVYHEAFPITKKDNIEI